MPAFSTFDTMMSAVVPSFTGMFGEATAQIFVQDFLLNADGEQVFNSNNEPVVTGDGGWVTAELIFAPDELVEVFDTGADTIDFDLDVCYIPYSVCPYPVVMGRSSPGTQLKRGGSTEVWYVRQIIECGRSGGGFHRCLIANSDGPIEGV